MQESKKYPSVAVITINFNHSNVTVQCIRSILKSDYLNYKIYVVDNGSRQSDLKNLKKELGNSANILELRTNIGYVGGINFGLKQVSKISPDYFLIMNNDTIIDSSAIFHLIETAEKYNRLAIVSGKVYNYDEPDSLQYIGQWCRNFNMLDFPPYIKNERQLDTGEFDQEMEMGMIDDIYWLLPKNIFNEVGFYSKYFFLYGEQNDYALRAIKKGYKLIYTPKAKIWHYGYLTTTGEGQKVSPKVIYWQFYSTLILTYLHLNFYYFFRFYFLNIIKLITKYIFNIINKKRKYLVIVPRIRAYYYFTKWLFKKIENNGFNPYKE